MWNTIRLGNGSQSRWMGLASNSKSEPPMSNGQKSDLMEADALKTESSHQPRWKPDAKCTTMVGDGGVVSDEGTK